MRKLLTAGNIILELYFWFFIFMTITVSGIFFIPALVILVIQFKGAYSGEPTG